MKCVSNDVFYGGSMGTFRPYDWPISGCKNELPPSQIPSFSSYTDLMELDPSTISFLPDSSDIAAETAAEAAAAAKVARKKERKAPTKKTPMQLDILGKRFGDIIGSGDTDGWLKIIYRTSFSF